MADYDPEEYYEWEDQKDKWYNKLQVNPVVLIALAFIGLFFYIYATQNKLDSKVILGGFVILVVIFFVLSRGQRQTTYLTEKQARAIAEEQLKDKRKVFTLYEKGLPEGDVYFGISRLLKSPTPPYERDEWKFAVRVDRGWGRTDKFFTVSVDARLDGIGLSGITEETRPWKGEETKRFFVPVYEPEHFEKVREALKRSER